MKPENSSDYLELEAGIVSEIVPHEKSKYFLRSDGVAKIQDFDTSRLIDDYSKAFPSVSKDEIKGSVMQAIYHHYLR